MTRLTEKELVAEAARWAHQPPALAGWVDAPEAVARGGESVSISMRLPKLMLEVLREFARREGTGYQVLMKRWLDERIREEARTIRRRVTVLRVHQPQILRQAASFEPPERALEREEKDHVKP